MKTVTNLNSEIYYHGNYWNDIPIIDKYISKNLTGDENKYWIADFKEKYATKPFQHALFINCGDGRWEREFIDRNIVKKATAFDVSPELINTAKKQIGKRRIKYIVADANKIRFKKNTFDLVVNIAALHHTQYINRMCLQLSNALKDDGYLVSHDYIGPGRNQYPLLNWILVRLVNLLLPNSIKKTNIGYPHLPTMLVTDPTEAIHSNLIPKTVRRYFKIIENHNSNGGVAYEIFTHNKNMTSKLLSKHSTNKYIQRVLKFDNILTRIGLVPVYFSLIIAQPNKNILKNKKRKKYFQNKELIRERYAQNLNNTYSFFDYLKIIKNTNSNTKRVNLILVYIKCKPKMLIFNITNYIKYSL